MMDKLNKCAVTQRQRLVGRAPGSTQSRMAVGQRSEQGVALIAALFLLVALAALAVYMVTISGVQQQTPTLAADASRAWYAARSGIEAVASEATTSNACPDGNGGTTDLNLDGFDVDVVCYVTNHTERGPPPFQVFLLTAKAEKGTYGGLNYVSRTAQATVTTAD